MTYHNPSIANVATTLVQRLEGLTNKSDILKATELKDLYAAIPKLAADERAAFGKELNQLKQELQRLVGEQRQPVESLPPIDVSAPFDINVAVQDQPKLLPSQQGTVHPLMLERQYMLDIFCNMGFAAAESRELDDDFHMFGSLNFPIGHPARDDYDTFMTVETDAQGQCFIAPAHTSTMQNRMLKRYKADLEQGQPIAVVIPDRVFRNEDLDARHEHTFYQLEGVYVGRDVNVGNLIATLNAWLTSYYGKPADVKIQPFYFPFTEPSFEFASSCSFCDGQGCNICSQTGWIELGGCGMIHPNVLEAAGIDSNLYSGFAWGFGIERLAMLKYGIEDVRHFESGKLDFLRQFK